MDIIKLMVPQ